MSSSPRRRPRRRIGLVAAACAVGAALATPSYAAAVGTVSSYGDTVGYGAAEGVVNDITVTASPGSVTIHDASDTITITSSGDNSRCTGDGTNTVVCTDPEIARWVADAGDMDDRIESLGPSWGSSFGGAGADELISREAGSILTGGDGPDTLIGGPSADLLLGDADADTIVGNGGDDFVFTSTGADVISLGEGDDRLQPVGQGTVADLGSGDDTYFFGADPATGAISVDGGTGTDDLSAFAFAEPFYGLAIDLAGGTLTLKAPEPASQSINGFEDVTGTVVGGDLITGTPGPNTIVTGPSAMLQYLYVGSGEDSRLSDNVDPGAGPDLVDTGRGDDTIATVDGYSDRLVCGAGTDSVTVDQFDAFESCENVTTQRVGLAAPVADVKPPVCGFTRASKRRVKRKAFLRGYAATFKCDEQVTATGRIVVAAKVRKGKVVLAKVGDTTLVQKTTQSAAGAATKLSLKPPRKLGRALPARFRARIVIDARDQFGNTTTATRHVNVTKPKAKRGNR